MTKEFSVECKLCKGSTTFSVSDVEALVSYIEGECKTAHDEGYDEGSDERDETCEVGDVVQAPSRPLWQLAAALRRRDLAEAEQHLDEVARLLSEQATEQVQQGRFSYAAKVPGDGAQKYLVWSNEHGAWWGPDCRGYTRTIANAGRYDRAKALSIAGTRDGGWHVRKDNPDEIAIPEQDALEQYADITRAQIAELRKTGT